MQLEKALAQLSEIHAQVLKTEVFRGYRAVTMLLTAAIAVVAGWYGSAVLQPSTAEEFTVFWVGVAVCCAGICLVDMYWRSVRMGSRSLTWRTILVVAQSLPALLVGAVVTWVILARSGSEFLLPGLWSMIFALGIWSARPYLPQAVGLVALFYLLAGAWLLVTTDATVPGSWGMGLTFGIGQTALAVVLYLNVERPLMIPNEDA